MAGSAGRARLMKLALESLAGSLAQRLLPAYLVSGDEPLLVTEALDAIRARARAAGFSEREVFHIERGGTPWDAVLQAAQSLSLFAARRIVEIRLPSGKPGVSGAEVLARIVEASGEDLLTLVVTGRLDREAQGSAWVRALSSRGAWIPVWPVERDRLPQWLGARLRALGLSADARALELLAERSEGHLLAARQEIEKLALLHPAGSRVSVEEVAAASADSARFDVFQLGEAVRSRDSARALRILASLEQEGTEATLALWALLRELHQQPLPGARGSRRRARLIARAVRADRAAKGLLAADAWDELALLIVEMSEAARLPLASARLALAAVGHDT